MQEEDPERAKVFEAGMPKVIQMILKSFKDWEFFYGESMNYEEGTCGLLNYKEDENGDEVPYMIFLKDALEEMKVVRIVDKSYLERKHYSVSQKLEKTMPHIENDM